MDSKLYNRIVEYAIEIQNGGNLPWQGLHTAKAVYEYLRKSGEPLSPDQIASELEISAEYVNQIILALQNGGVTIDVIPGEKKWTGRPQSTYRV